MGIRRYVSPCALALALTIVTSPPHPASAQVSPSDSAAVLLDAAARFTSEGRNDVAEALYRYIVEHFPDTPAAVLARSRLDEAQAAGTAGSGRVELQVWATTYGLWLGVAIPGALGVDDPEPYGVGLLLGGPLGFVGGRALAGTRDLTEGQARALTLGGSWGTWQGFGWAEVLDLGEELVCFDGPFGEECYDQGDHTEETFAAMIVGGLAGIATGAALSGRTISPGTATAANFGALWGTWFGFAGAYLAGLNDDALMASTLLGGNAGLASMALAAPGWNLSRSRARLVSIYGVIGGLGGLGLDLILQPDDDKTAVAIPLLGSVVGLALGVGSTGDVDGSTPVIGASLPGMGALLLRDGGAWRLGTPLPAPRLLPWDGPGHGGWRTALSLELVRARF